MRRKQGDHVFVLCVKNVDCDDLGKRKVYRVLLDEKAEKDGYVRVVDESGEDYLYPSSYFVRVQLPQEAQQAIVATGVARRGDPLKGSDPSLKAIRGKRRADLLPEYDFSKGVRGK